MMSNKQLKFRNNLYKVVMLQWQLQAGLLLSLGLLSWHITESSAAPCTSETCTSLARSWEGARAAAKAAYERNLQAAGLAGHAQAAPAAPKVAAGATVPELPAHVAVFGAPVATINGVDQSGTVPASLVARQQVQQLQDAVRQLEAAVMKKTNSEQPQQEAGEHNKEAGEALSKQQARKDGSTPFHLPQVAAAAAVTAADVSRQTSISATAVHSSRQQLQQLEAAVFQLEAAVHSSKLQLQQHGQQEQGNQPMMNGQACTSSNNAVFVPPSSAAPPPSSSPSAVMSAEPAAAKVDPSKAAAGVAARQQMQQLGLVFAHSDASVQQPQQKQDEGRMQPQTRQAVQWSLNSNILARSAAAASALAAAAAAGQKRVAATAMAGQEKLKAGFSAMSATVPAGIAALQEKLPAAVPVFSSKTLQNNSKASSCAATQQQVQELRAAVLQLEAKLSQQQQEWQQQAGQSQQLMWWLIYPCLIFLGWLLRGLGSPQLPPAASLAAANTTHPITNVAAKVQVNAASGHPSTIDAAKVATDQLLQGGEVQPLLARAPGSNCSGGSSSNSAAGGGGGGSAAAGGGGSAGGRCSGALHTAEAPAGEQQSGVQDETQPACAASDQASFGTCSVHELYPAAGEEAAPADGARLQQQAGASFSCKTSSNELAEVTAKEVQRPIRRSSSGGSSNGDRRSRRCISSSAARRTRRATSHGDGSGAMVVRQQQLAGAQQDGVIVACSEETMKTIIQPAVVVLTQLSHGINTLAVTTAAVVHHLSQVASMGTRLVAQVEQLLSFAGKQEREQRMAAQRALGERSGQLGLALLLLALGAAALKVGRFWEVHEVCSGSSRQHPSSWVGRLTGTSTVNHAWQYMTCCVHQLGLYAVGLVVLYHLALITWRGLFSSRHASSSTSNWSWQLDLVIFRGVVCSIVGVHVVHCLGAAWLPWLLLWLIWTGSQLLLQVKQLTMGLSALTVLNVALVLPLFMAVAPFHPCGVLLQGRLLEAMPWLHQLMVVPKLLGLQW